MIRFPLIPSAYMAELLLLVLLLWDKRRYLFFTCFAAMRRSLSRSLLFPLWDFPDVVRPQENHHRTLEQEFRIMADEALDSNIQKIKRNIQKYAERGKTSRVYQVPGLATRLLHNPGIVDLCRPQSPDRTSASIFSWDKHFDMVHDLLAVN